MSQVLYDEPGPVTRRRIRIGTIVAAVVLAGVVVLALVQLNSQGVFEPRRWSIYEDPQVWESLLWRGLVLGTLRAAAVAAVIAVVVGLLLAVARMSETAWLRIPAMVVIEVFRGLPVLLLILFSALAMGLSIFQAVILGLAVYNSAVIGEILRAGILSLPKGQREAALAVGMSPTQTLLLVLLPQAVRRMMPSLVSQLVVLLKDTSLGFIVGYSELLRTSRELRDFFGNTYLFSIFVVAATIYIAVNFALSRFAVYLERRGTKKAAGGAAPIDDAEGGAPGPTGFDHGARNLLGGYDPNSTRMYEGGRSE